MSLLFSSLWPQKENSITTGDPAAAPPPGFAAGMDLTFVTERILSLSFASEISASVYRNALKSAANMLHTKYADNYMVIKNCLNATLFFSVNNRQRSLHLFMLPI